MKKVVVGAVALGLLASYPGLAAAGVAAETQDEIQKELEYLRLKMSSQMERIEQLEDKLKKQGEEGGKVALANKFIDQLTIKGDLRARYERRDLDYYSQSTSTDVARDRWRTRFRLGGEWENKAENWIVAAGLATGEEQTTSSDGSHLATSTNGTWSNKSPFQSNDIWLDYAYAAHKWDDFKFTLGQQFNPYETSWVLWDGDVRLAGITGQYSKKDGLFATVGGYAAKLVNSDNTAMLYMGQAGYRGKVDKVSYTVAAGYHTYDQSFINDGKTDTVTTTLNNIDTSQYAMDIGDLFAKVSFPVAAANLSLYGHIWQNFGADGDIGESQIKNFPKKPEDADLGWVLGLDVKIDKVKLGYAYSVVEADSLYGGLTDSDFGDGVSTTNKKGHRLQAGYEFSKNWSADVTWLNYEQDEAFYNATSSKVDSVDLYQFDVNYKF